MKNDIILDPCPPIWVLAKKIAETYYKIIKTKIKKIWNKYL